MTRPPLHIYFTDITYLPNVPISTFLITESQVVITETVDL